MFRTVSLSIIRSLPIVVCTILGSWWWTDKLS